MSDPNEATQRVKELLGPERVRDGKGDPRYAFNGVSPRLILYPGRSDELSALVMEANAARLTLIPWGGGTKQHHGYFPKNCDWVVDLGRMQGVSEHQKADFVVSFHAGTTLRAANDFLRESDQFLPLDPLEGDTATLGGICAANASGPLRLGYGTPRDLVLEMGVVMADGTPVRFGAKVVKSVAGFDLNKLYIGSQGTLGFISEVTLKSYSLRIGEGALIAEFEEAGAAQSAATRILSGRTLPVALEWLTGEEMVNDEIAAGLSDSKNILLVSYRDNEQGVLGQLDKAETTCRECAAKEISKLGGEDAQAFRESLSRNGPFHASARWAGFVCRMGVPLTRVGETIERSRVIGRQEGFRVWGQAQAGNGIIRLGFGWPEGDSALPSDKAVRAAKGLQKAAGLVGGYAVIETRSQELREKLDLYDEERVGETVFQLMQKAKQALDPEGIMNPGRFFGKI